MLEHHGFESICTASDLEQWGQIRLDPRELMQCSFKEIDKSDILIVELTEKGVGIGIEAGYAFAKKIPIMTIAKKGSDISQTLQGISQWVCLYDQYDDLNPFLSDLSTIVDKLR